MGILDPFYLIVDMRQLRNVRLAASQHCAILWIFTDEEDEGLVEASDPEGVMERVEIVSVGFGLFRSKQRGR